MLYSDECLRKNDEKITAARDPSRDLRPQTPKQGAGIRLSIIRTAFSFFLPFFLFLASHLRLQSNSEAHKITVQHSLKILELILGPTCAVKLRYLPKHLILYATCFTDLSKAACCSSSLHHLTKPVKHEPY